MLEIRNVSYSYSDEAHALCGINVKFPPEHVSAILGESGSGKTTLLKCIGRFLRPREGAILLDGDDVHEMPDRDLRRKLGIVFQRLFCFPHMSVMRNMTLAPEKVLQRSRGEAEDAARDMLERLGIGDLGDRYPSQISGGQAQRVAIARGLMLQPRYMLLDEPTSALDARTTDEFAAWLCELQAETQFIIVTHDLPFAANVATHGVYLSEGRVHSAGEVKEIISRVRSDT